MNIIVHLGDFAEKVPIIQQEPTVDAAVFCKVKNNIITLVESRYY